MIRRSIFALALSLLVLLPLTTVPAAAQEWGQEVQIITRIQYGDPLHVFLDSLDSVLDRNPEMRVRRTEQDEQPIPYRELRDQLYEDGIDLLSATHAFIRYRFDLEDRARMVETMKEMYFIFRADESESDVPILHVRSRDPVITHLLEDGGIASVVNMKAVTPFRKLFSFPTLSQNPESAMVEFGGRPLRDDFVHEQALFKQFLTEYMTIQGGSYVLSTEDQTVAMLDSGPTR